MEARATGASAGFSLACLCLLANVPVGGDRDIIYPKVIAISGHHLSLSPPVSRSQKKGKGPL